MAKKSGVYVRTDPVPARVQIDAIIDNTHDWRGKKLDLLRSIIMKTNENITEEVKWKKPSRPEGVPVWSHMLLDKGIACKQSRPEGVPVWSLNGIICVADIFEGKGETHISSGGENPIVC
jgi:Uncharacterized conserved protein